MACIYHMHHEGAVMNFVLNCRQEIFKYSELKVRREHSIFEDHQRVCNPVVGKKKETLPSQMRRFKQDKLCSSKCRCRIFKSRAHCFETSFFSSVLEKWSPDERSTMSADGTVPTPPPPRWSTGVASTVLQVGYGRPGSNDLVAESDGLVQR
ncbi:hypothetical protein CDAR_208421 [Caerostris darwini]|uniref:Uncharacterized protein n=1 Tax=Caerostris darwini TaxID=1538125 RepID=A0AAV4WTY4_9ARAC|nr:hypothetical protein CDAR_208421 [Caerostris darwini]